MLNFRKVLLGFSVIILGLASVADSSDNNLININKAYDNCIQEVLRKYISGRDSLREGGPATSKSGHLKVLETTAKIDMLKCGGKHPGSLETSTETNELLKKAGFTNTTYYEVLS